MFLPCAKIQRGPRPPDADVHGQGCGSGSLKRLNFCESGSILKKEAGNGSKLGSD